VSERPSNLTNLYEIPQRTSRVSDDGLIGVRDESLGYCDYGMKYKTFEEWLTDWFLRDYHGDKENFESAYDNWLSELDGEDYIKYGNYLARENFLRGMDDVMKTFKV